MKTSSKPNSNHFNVKANGTARVKAPQTHNQRNMRNAQPNRNPVRSNRSNVLSASAGAVQHPGMSRTPGVKVRPRAAAPEKQKPVKRRAAKVHEPLLGFDTFFFTLVVILLIFGTLMMYSASYVIAYKEHGDGNYFLMNQLAFIGVGVVAMLVLSTVDYHIILQKKIMWFCVIAAFILTWMVKFGMGVTQGGAERWLNFFGLFTFQPSELLKMAIIMAYANFAQTLFDKRDSFKKGFLPYVILLFAACGTTVLQPHLSATVIIFAVAIIMMIVAQCRTKYMVGLGLFFVIAAAVAIGALYAMGRIDYVESRITSWLNPYSDIGDTTYQTYQSLVTIGSGGLFGLGLGLSRQKFSFMPASENDFVFSITVEELGFIGAIAILLLFCIFMWRGCYIAGKARDRGGMLLAVGITMQIGLQAFLNIGVVTNSLPNTGISLPFFSYGGTAILLQLMEIGVLLNISRKAAIE